MKTVRILLSALAATSALLSTQCFAQTPAGVSSSSYASLGLGAFIPLEQSFRINYSTSTLGLPIELDASLQMPVTSSLLLEVAAAYRDREANFISDTRISSVEIQPGVRVYLEPQRPKDFRIFALGALVISRSTVTSVVDATPDGNDPVSEAVSRSYLPIGGAAGLGLSYPLTDETWIDAVVRASVFFGSPATSGGLGNIGGVSLIAAYRFGL